MLSVVVVAAMMLHCNASCCVAAPTCTDCTDDDYIQGDAAAPGEKKAIGAAEDNKDIAERVARHVARALVESDVGARGDAAISLMLLGKFWEAKGDNKPLAKIVAEINSRKVAWQQRNQPPMLKKAREVVLKAYGTDECCACARHIVDLMVHPANRPALLSSGTSEAARRGANF